MELKEGIDVLARLADDDIRLSGAPVPADQRELSPDDGGRVLPGFQKNLRDHRGGRGFAVCSGDGDGLREMPRHHAEHHGPLHHGDSLVARRDQLRIILLDRRGVDDQLRALHVFGPLPHEDGDAVASDSGEGVGLAGIGTGQPVPFMQQDFGDRAHAGPADPHKMDSFYF